MELGGGSQARCTPSLSDPALFSLALCICFLPTLTKLSLHRAGFGQALLPRGLCLTVLDQQRLVAQGLEFPESQVAILVQSVWPGRLGPHLQGLSMGWGAGSQGGAWARLTPLMGVCSLRRKELGLGQASGTDSGWVGFLWALERMFRSAWFCFFLSM